MRTMKSAKLAAILTLVAVSAPLPPSVSGIQCWQCAAVDGRKCPDNSNMVDSPQVSCFHMNPSFEERLSFL